MEPSSCCSAAIKAMCVGLVLATGSMALTACNEGEIEDVGEEIDDAVDDATDDVEPEL